MTTSTAAKRYCFRCNKDVMTTKHGHCPNCAAYIVTGAKRVDVNAGRYSRP